MIVDHLVCGVWFMAAFGLCDARGEPRIVLSSQEGL